MIETWKLVAVEEKFDGEGRNALPAYIAHEKQNLSGCRK
jgi:hypothetical protein